MLNQLALKFISASFYIAVWFIHLVFLKKEPLIDIAELEKQPEGSLGRAIAHCLQQHKLSFVPYFESHDLKHVVFDYKMSPLDEIRLQACMIGNGNWSLPSIAIFLFGAILLPSQWSLFYKDFRKGLEAQPIKDWSIDAYASQDLLKLRQQVLAWRSSTVASSLLLSQLNKVASIGLILTGIVGMIYCLPYLYSTNIADLIGAGFPFVAGSILMVGGFINLSLNARKDILLQTNRL